MQSAFGFTTANLKFQDLSSSIFKPLIFLKFQVVNQKTDLQSFRDCRSGWSKDFGCISFWHIFLLVYNNVFLVVTRYFLIVDRKYFRKIRACGI